MIQRYIADLDGDSLREVVLYTDHLEELDHALKDAAGRIAELEAKRDRWRAECLLAQIDLDKPTQERSYCRGCSLPGEITRLTAEVVKYREALGRASLKNEGDNLQLVWWDTSDVYKKLEEIVFIAREALREG